MADERLEVSLADLTRWLVVAALVIVGVVCYIWLAPETAPVARPPAHTVAP